MSSQQAIIDLVLGRQRTGSLLCTSCGVLVGVNDATCYNCGRRNPGLWGFGPALRVLGRDLGFVPFVIGTCVVLYLLTLVFTRGSLGGGGPLSLFAPGTLALFSFGASGSEPVFTYGRWWTVFSAGWLHANALHILFNMLGVRQLAPTTAEFYGPGRMVIIYSAASVAGFALSSFAGAYLPDILFLSGGRFTVGASASVFGLVGALVYYGHRVGSRHISSTATSWALSMALYGFIMPGIDNYAHLGGFAGGYGMARLLDPLKPERIDHVAMAIGCLLLSLAAVGASLWFGLG